MFGLRWVSSVRKGGWAEGGGGGLDSLPRSERWMSRSEREKAWLGCLCIFLFESFDG